MLISFIGIDGSGKTTLATKLFNELNKSDGNTNFLHFDSIFIDKLVVRSNREKSHNKIKNDKIKKKSNLNFIKGNMWCLLIFLDNILFYMLHYFKIKNKSSKITITDRYFYDSLISCVNASGSDYFVNIYNNFFPKPDIIFLLDINPSLAFERKKEDNINYLFMKRELYMKFFNETDVITIDASRESDILYDEIRKIIQKFNEVNTNEL